MADGYQGLRSLYESCPDLVIMAQHLSALNAKELCARLRQVSYLPIIVLGNGEKKGTEGSEMLELGADAYMSTPPDLTELIARVGSLLRRRRGLVTDSPEGDSGTVLEPPTFRGNSHGDLTSTEFRLLSCLMLNEGRLVSHSQLVSEVWGGKPVSKDCLKFYVRRLRQKPGQACTSPSYILNQRGMGYRFCRTN